MSTVTSTLPLVLPGSLAESTLAGEVVLVTGAGGGIGLEAARSLLHLGAIDCDVAVVRRLAAFYGHLGDLAAGYVKDPEERAQQLAITAAWRAEVEALAGALATRSLAPAETQR